MKTQALLPASDDPTEALLLGLMGECHEAIRDLLMPELRKTAGHHQHGGPLGAMNDLIRSATLLSDAIGRLRGTAPQPEIRQRITVERVEKLPAPGTP